MALRFQQLHFFQKLGRTASVGELVVDSGMIVWAYHSDCQENLFGAVLANEPSWQEMRAMGVGFWFTNTTQLRSRVMFPAFIIIFLVPCTILGKWLNLLNSNRKGLSSLPE